MANRQKRLSPSEIVVFSGTSLTHAEVALQLPGVATKPPIARGDLDRLPTKFKVAAIIDGVFHQTLPIQPLEIRRALERGLRVYGASSMGALRASELHVCGMIGVGHIFEWYRDAVIDADDEVALSFDPDTLRPLNVPLVNIRYGLQRLVAERTLTESQAEALLSAARSLHFTERSYRRLLRSASAELPPDLNLPDLERRLEAFDLKREDALACLREVKRLVG